MVKTTTKENQTFYQCEECGFRYREEEWAKKCEAWCQEHKTCNLEITKHAVKENPQEIKNPELTKKERKAIKKEEKEEACLRVKRQKLLKKFLSIAVIILLIGGGIYGFSWLLSKNPGDSRTQPKIISHQGIHWHAKLEITILGERIEIPANVGIGITHAPLHTHELDNIIHLEFSGVAREEDIKLARFFEIWDKTFNKECIFDKCQGPEGKLKMLVNNQENSDFENYVMRDGDVIQIISE